MLEIKDVVVKGFQSHKESGFTLSPGLTVITGPSDAGKTAIIRALRWLAFNEPQGEGFLYTVRNADGSIKEQEEQAEVTVNFESGVSITKTRRKGKTTYIHSLYPEPWEKADVPQEIKDALGLTKQTYGDNFETCLNFAFQLDPPFLLSETGGTGAKVLGKLAGTEVVDKAIGAVNKRTHNTRTELAQADKQIGQLDVELLEYLEVDDHYSVLEGLEIRFQTVETGLSLQKDLVEKKNQHEALTNRIVELNQKLEPLQMVPALLINLKAVGLSEDRKQIIEKLQDDFWKAINDSKNARQLIRDLKDVPSLLQRTKTLSNTEDRLIALKDIQTRYRGLQELITRHEATVAAADKVLDNINLVANIVKNSHTSEQLNTLLGKHRVAQNARNVLIDRLASLEHINALKGKITALPATVDKLTVFENLTNKHLESKVARIDAKFELQTAIDNLQIAKELLTEEWEAAGGICPLCEQLIGRGDTNCTH